MIGRRRWFVAAVLGGLLLLGACGGSDNKSASSASSSAPPSTLTEQQSKAAISKVFVDFFNGANPDLDAKIKLVDNPTKYEALYRRFASGATTGPQLASTSVTVTDVTLNGDGTAQVKYTLNLNGNPTLADQLGTAAFVDGQWRVSGTTFCDLAALSDPANAQDPACQ